MELGKKMAPLRKEGVQIIPLIVTKLTDEISSEKKVHEEKASRTRIGNSSL
jgi:hypothetical protein